MKVKIGDNVFDIQYGWLKITEFNDRFLKATNTNSGEHTYYLNGLEYGNDIITLSFTEYDLVNGGFSQERPINLKSRECVLGRNGENNPWELDVFENYDSGDDYPFNCNYSAYKMCVPYIGHEDLLDTDKNAE